MGNENRAQPSGPVPGADTSARPSLSPSRAGDFLTCPLLYRFRVIDRLPEPPSAAAARGTLVHAVLERLFDEPAARRTPETARAMIAPQWERLIAEEPELAGLFSDDQEWSAWLAEASGMLDRYFTLEDPTRLEPRHREHAVHAVLDSGLLLRGFIDRLDVRADGEIRIVDYKTGTAPREEFEARALFQMKFYAVVLWLTGGGCRSCCSSCTWATARSCGTRRTRTTCAPRYGRSMRCGGRSSGPAPRRLAAAAEQALCLVRAPGHMPGVRRHSAAAAPSRARR